MSEKPNLRDLATIVVCRDGPGDHVPHVEPDALTEFLGALCDRVEALEAAD